MQRADRVTKQQVEGFFQRQRGGSERDHDALNDGQRQFSHFQSVPRTKRLGQDLAEEHDEHRRHQEPD